MAQGVEICHLTLASTKSRSAALDFLNNSKFPYRHRTYKAKGNWYVVTAGVDTKSSGEEKLKILKENNLIPKDSYCSDGKSFIEEISRSDLENLSIPDDFNQAIKLTETEVVYTCEVEFDPQFTDLTPFSTECHAYLDEDVADVNMNKKGLMFRLSRVQPEFDFFHIYWNKIPFNYDNDITGNLGIVEYKENCFHSGVVSICFKGS